MSLPTSVKGFLSHPAGPFTSNIFTILKLIFVVFFWAPMCKWLITISNISDLDRPAENISTN
jgi:hypothetical protein